MSARSVSVKRKREERGRGEIRRGEKLLRGRGRGYMRKLR